jgi:putative hydrolase of HD superfamily
MTADRLERQLAFIMELDRLKQVLRRNVIADRSRQENTAEHSWHIAMMALVLGEHADGEVDIGRVTKMLLLHDVIEIDAGDTFAYDAAATRDQAERERVAADRLFGLLPDDQGGDLRALWEEFEAEESADAVFARCLDRMQPLLLNRATDGVSWRRHGVTVDQVLARNSIIKDAAPSLWAVVERLVAESAEEGLLAPRAQDS